MTAMIETNELFNLLDDPKVKIFDATYPAAHASLDIIPGAQFFDIDEISNPDAALPHTAPAPETFELHMQALGINKDDTVVVYDQKNVAMAAARAWWMFRLYGFDNVKVLNGGMRKWVQDGYDTIVYKPQNLPRGDFRSTYRPELLMTTQDVLDNLRDNDCQMIDARSADRFAELDGHIPDSINACFVDIIDQETGGLKPADYLKDAFEKSGVDLGKKVATTCGSGVTACTLALALYEIGITDVPVYDGSWTEWSGRDDTPKVHVPTGRSA